jgi:hypothetical protein
MIKVVLHVHAKQVIFICDLRTIHTSFLKRQADGLEQSGPHHHLIEN